MTPQKAETRQVTRVLVGWLDSEGVYRPKAKSKLSEIEALELLTDDIEQFGEPST